MYLTLHIESLRLRPVAALHLTINVWSTLEPVPHLLITARAAQSTNQRGDKQLAGICARFGGYKATYIRESLFLLRLEKVSNNVLLGAADKIVETGSILDNYIYPYLFNHLWNSNNPKILALTPSQ